MVPGKKGASRVRNMCQVPGTIRREARRARATAAPGILNIQPRIHRGWRHHLLSFATLYRHAPFLPSAKTNQTDALLQLLIFIRLVYRTISVCVSTATVAIPTAHGISWYQSTVSFRGCYISYCCRPYIFILSKMRTGTSSGCWCQCSRVGSPHLIIRASCFPSCHKVDLNCLRYSRVVTKYDIRSSAQVVAKYNVRINAQVVAKFNARGQSQVVAKYNYDVIPNISRCTFFEVIPKFSQSIMSNVIPKLSQSKMLEVMSKLSQRRMSKVMLKLSQSIMSEVMPKLY